MKGKRITVCKKNNQEQKDNYPIRVAQIMGKHVTGGIKSVIMNYYEHIDRNIIQFDFFVDSDSPLKDYSDIERMGGRVYEIPPVTNLFHHINECRKLLKEENYLIAHAYINTLNVFPMFAAFLAGVPVRIAENLSTAHPGERKTVLKNILRPLARLFPTHIAANSVFSGEWIYGKRNMKNCKIICNAIDLNKFCYDEDLRIKTREEYGWNKKFVIGHIGRYHYQKNHEYLIEIFEAVHKKDPDAVLVLIGYGELKDHIFEMIEKKGLSSYVFDLGGREDITQFYNAMDCFVLPSFYEGLPVVGIEAQATGLPCILSSEITKETKITDVVDFVNLKQSPEEWADTILKWKGYHRRDLSKQITANGYNIEKEAHVLKEYYLSCIRDSKYDCR